MQIYIIKFSCPHIESVPLENNSNFFNPIQVGLLVERSMVGARGQKTAPIDRALLVGFGKNSLARL